MKLLVVILIVIAFQATFVLSNEVTIEKQIAMEFLNEDSPAIQKRFLYTGREQRREAKENYEEKCERSTFSKWRGKPRW